MRPGKRDIEVRKYGRRRHEAVKGLKGMDIEGCNHDGRHDTRDAGAGQDGDECHRGMVDMWVLQI